MDSSASLLSYNGKDLTWNFSLNYSIDFTSSAKARHYREEEFYLVRFFAVVLPAHARIFSQM